MDKIFHLTHIDSDAVGCAVLLNLYYKCLGKDGAAEYSTYYSTNGDANDKFLKILNECTYDSELYGRENTYVIIMSDISVPADSEAYNVLLDIYNRKLMDNKWNGYNFKIFMFDHHKTNPFIDMPSTDDFIIRVNNDDDINISAVEVMYHYITNLVDNMGSDAPDELVKLMRNKNVEKFVIDISRYDTWRWVENPSEFGGEDAVTNVLKYTTLLDLTTDITNFLYEFVVFSNPDNDPFEAPKYSGTAESWKMYIPEKYRTMHEIAVKEFNRYMCDIEKKVRISTSGEYLYGLLICDNNSINMSLVSDKINRDILHGLLDYIVILYPSTRALSFRTTSDTVDVSRIASRCYGGGGHTKAAGARLDIPTFTSFITEYWTSISFDTIDNYFIRNEIELNDTNILKFINEPQEE